MEENTPNRENSKKLKDVDLAIIICAISTHIKSCNGDIAKLRQEVVELLNLKHEQDPTAVARKQDVITLLGDIEKLEKGCREMCKIVRGLEGEIKVEEEINEVSLP